MIELIEYCGDEYRFDKNGKEVMLYHEIEYSGREKITCNDEEVKQNFMARWDVDGFDDTPVL